MVDADVVDAAAVANRLSGLSRRDFLRATGATGAMCLLAATGLVSACTQKQLDDIIAKIKNRPVRKDISKLASDDPVLGSYEKAILAMKALPSSDKRNWANQAQIHNDFCPHNNWLLLPWHRAYIWYFEEICRELSGDNGFALPYWNWTANPKIPPVFFNTASPLYDSSRVAGPATIMSSSFVGQPVIDNILMETNFLNFGSGKILDTDPQRTPSTTDPLEGTPHNHIHTAIGGHMGAFHSPLDPIFWTHHGRLDELWVEWNLTRGNPNSNDEMWAGRHFTEFCDRHGNPVNVTVFTTILMPLFSYRYDTQVP